jgi:hypothetical protein
VGAPEARVTTPLFFETVVALVESVQPPDGTPLLIESVALEVPLEGRVVSGGAGTPEFRAGLPHTRWRSGVLPAVHVAHLELTSDGAATDEA